MSIKIVFGGPPRSGKSCLRAGILEHIRTLGEYIYFITANPDGEGAWFHAAAETDPEKARLYKEVNKQAWSDHFEDRVRLYCESVRDCQQPLVGVDIGGLITPDNKLICRHATHAILLAGDTEDETWTQRLQPWREMMRECGLVILAELYSDYHGTEDRFDAIDDQGVFRGSVHYLERGAPLSNRTTIQSLARYILEQSNQAN